ncbi:MAG TPA: phosphoglycerate kinase [Candidatus Baltobacteraceae bacterium]|nr:phosphoglycerate kinase [Candidatus Baltobacteraceae bacterium]
MRFVTLPQAGNLRGKRVVVREDLNVPMHDGAVADETRIVAALETLRYLRDAGAKTIVLSHLGRPDGKVVPALSLRPVAAELAQRIGSPVAFATDCVGPVAEAAAAALADGDVVVLENVRFHPEEERNDPGFAKQLARLGDLYVNDAFGTAHRAHASTEGIAADLPAVAGFLMAAELEALERLTSSPAQPFVCAIGGAKVKDKIGIFTHLIERVNSFVIGGGMANTFLAAQGIGVGKSLRDADLEPAKTILALAASKKVPLHLPSDAVVAPAFDADDRAHVVALADIGDELILDIGPRTAEAYATVLGAARTIVFNGPMGVYEKRAYQSGTRAVGDAIAAATRAGAVSVVGGGDAAAAAHELGFASAMTHVSTGGGATLEFLEGKTLPGVAALERAAERQGVRA